MRPEQWTFFLAMAAKPLAALLFLWVAMNISRLIVPFIPEGKIKRLLLIRLNDSGSSGAQSGTPAAQPVDESLHLGRHKP
jgi:hypothetical protein